MPFGATRQTCALVVVRNLHWCRSMSARVEKTTKSNGQHSSSRMGYNECRHGSNCHTLVTNKSGIAANSMSNGHTDGNSTPRSITNGTRAQHFPSPGVTSDLILSEELLTELTGKTRRSAQRRILTFLGIPYRLRPDGSLVVHRASVDESLGAITKSAPTRTRSRPNWND